MVIRLHLIKLRCLCCHPITTNSVLSFHYHDHFTNHDNSVVGPKDTQHYSLHCKIIYGQTRVLKSEEFALCFVCLFHLCSLGCNDVNLGQQTKRIHSFISDFGNIITFLLKTASPRCRFTHHLTCRYSSIIYNSTDL